MRDPTHYCTLRNLCSRRPTKAQKGAGLTYDGEDFFPDDFLQKQHEFTREEDHVGKHPLKDKDGKPLRPNFEESNRRSQALENMTEQLQGNMNQDDEYDDEED
jgi:hypothetical protein